MEDTQKVTSNQKSKQLSLSPNQMKATGHRWNPSLKKKCTTTHVVITIYMLMSAKMRRTSRLLPSSTEGLSRNHAKHRKKRQPLVVLKATKYTITQEMKFTRRSNEVID